MSKLVRDKYAFEFKQEAGLLVKPSVSLRLQQILPCRRKPLGATVYSAYGDRWDNGCSKSLFGSLKTEVIYGNQFKTRRQAKDKIVE